ncbi:MAG: hypothetical protein HLUCCA05_11450 [Roseibaca calidilacus]|uniref:Uncharacterized protein n=2 Tax=Roseibaca calidilacus TaxID=1666912 RepID=A0A0P7W166_9RHOB|nr:MAG: hypothetical protein HLUCCA05_11450 [Roseibaca calidilacus]CUX80410.1 hypothetical protein Ga0058931_1119 [Roseibaca calidilacus]
MPPDVRFVKRLVVVLTSVMIVGVVLIVGLLVARITQTPAPVALPDSIDLPADTTPEAVTLARDWVLVLVADEILLFDRDTGALAHRITLP